MTRHHRIAMRVCAAVILTLAACGGEAEEPTSEPVAGVAHEVGWEGAPLEFAAWVPSEASADQPAPLIVALHGCCADDMTAEDLIPSILQGALELRDEPSPFIVIEPLKQPGFPLAELEREIDRGVRKGRCTRDATRGDAGSPHCLFEILHDRVRDGRTSVCFTPTDVKDFLEFAVEAYPVDADRIYLVGYSCGGFAVWEYLASYGAEQLAAAVVLAGDGRPALAEADHCRMAEVPVWALHGDDDVVVPLVGDQDTIDDLLQHCADHAELRLDVLAHAGHSETPALAYGEPELWGWLLDHHLAEG